MSTDWIYQCTIRDVVESGELINTRNAWVKSVINAAPIAFDTTPLVTLRKTAWKKAIKEMEWFLSGDPKCHNDLAATWWKGQLSKDNCYYGGYGQQLRSCGRYARPGYDQIKHLIEGLIYHPNSRRHVITTWNPWEMANIASINGNPNTPTTCHTTIAQFFVRNGKKLHMSTYQRSADILLGVPHNWIQSWALLIWLAHKSGLQVGTMRWLFGDLHLYQDESHVETAKELLTCKTYPVKERGFKLVYNPKAEWFKADDFYMIGDIPDAAVTRKPKLL